MGSAVDILQGFRRRVLLIGIDDYPDIFSSTAGKPCYLEGSVNDIDAFEGLLLDKLAVQPKDIRKLASPLPKAPRPGRVPEMPATAENILNAFQELADNTQKNDRVLIYYAGHGGRSTVSSGSGRYFREALLPSDIATKGRRIWDYEINAWLACIASKGADLTVILDCCHAAGTHRSLGKFPKKPTWRTREIEVETQGYAVPDVDNGLPRGIVRSSMEDWDPGYSLLAACHANEVAHEVTNGNGQTSGLLSSHLYGILSDCPDEKLHELRWNEVVTRMKMIENNVDECTLKQRPWFVGRKERRVFGGPFIVQDQGIGISKVGAKYRIQAGAWSGFSKGALVAVYGGETLEFPPIESPEEKAARIGTLRVEEEFGTYSIAVLEGVPFGVPSDGRARLIRAAPSERLKLALSPFQPNPAQFISKEGPFQIVPPELEKDADVVVEVLPGNGFRLSDPKDRERWEATGAAPLFEALDINVVQLSALLSHYQCYLRPLRMGRALSTVPPVLRIRLFDAAGVSMLPADQLQAPSLPEILPDSRMMDVCKVRKGQPICFAIENNQPIPLAVSLLRCTAGGKVELLGSGNELVPGMGIHRIYAGGELGRPFEAQSHCPSRACLDRYVVVGTNQKELDVSALVTGSNRDFEKAYGPSVRHHPRASGDSSTWLAAMLFVLVTP